MTTGRNYFTVSVLADGYTFMLLQAGFPTVGELFAEYTELFGKVAAFILAFVVVYLIGRFILAPLANRAMDRRGFDDTIANLAEKVVGVLTLFFALAVAFTVAGFGAFLAAFATLGGALALAFGFAAQDLLSNFVAGLFILKDRPFEIGDWIEWEGYAGRVQDIDLRVTRVKTFDNQLITVPNADLANNPLINPVAFDTLRQKFVFGIGYEDDINQATDIIIEEAEKIESILDDPGTTVRVTELGDSAVGLQSRFWIKNPNRADFVKTRSEYVQAVKERFDEEGIDMPYPYRQLTGGVTVDGIPQEVALEADDD
ncbi:MULTISPECIES: mechanosensitive ion channel family protein [unclassified Haladaptatus]|uniref:mechanosensitive ion channel family protein n=2 Tax=unclassified Haladaptatus TaxID=2622732 RepID=UPI0023E7DA7C|nr:MULTISPECIES: mechanosensitive ion channel family protein [unclassified Haladaptatus]